MKVSLVLLQKRLSIIPDDNVQNQELETKKRKTRGPTKMNKVAKNPEEKVDIEFTRLENMWGKDQSHFPPFLDH